MSYTVDDYLRDMRLPISREQVDELIELNLCVIRRRDVEALIRYATARGIGDPDDDDNWGRGDVNDDALMALANWQKEQRDWEP